MENLDLSKLVVELVATGPIGVILGWFMLEVRSLIREILGMNKQLLEVVQSNTKAIARSNELIARNNDVIAEIPVAIEKMKRYRDQAYYLNNQSPPEDTSH